MASCVTWATKILQLSEIRTVLEELDRRRHYRNATRAEAWWRNLILFRLSCCCGLRRIEIRNLQVSDLILEGARPCIRIRAEATKKSNGKGRARLVPLWWDQGTLQDIRDFHVWRTACISDPDEWLLVGPKSRKDRPMTNNRADERWRNALSPLGEVRARQLGIHCGRHSFCSHAIQAGRSLPEVRDAAGHCNVSITHQYLHAIESPNAVDLFPQDND